MNILISNALEQTTIFTAGIVLVFTTSIKRTAIGKFFSPETTTELKGLAILMVIFSHIGYFLVNDSRFLVPLSNYGGVGVDIFFMLSGFGLASAALERPQSVWQFYKKRLSRIYVPVCLTILLFVGLDYFFYRQAYTVKTIVESVLGFFPRADLWYDIDSPLWYITPLLFYYSVFPLIFWRRFPLLSAAVLTILGWHMIQFLPKWDIVSVDLVKMYRLHFLAFPLGIGIATLRNKPWTWLATAKEKIKSFFLKNDLLIAVRCTGIVMALAILYYTATNPQVGADWKTEELTSLFTTLAFVVIFMLKKISSRALIIIGTFSFELYLLHWPLLSRYNFLYGKMPAALATFLYLIFFLALSWLFQKIVTAIIRLRFSVKNKTSPIIG